MSTQKEPIENAVRIEFSHEAVSDRIKHYHEFTRPLSQEQIELQVQRCLHCGTPFCSSSCPLHNRAVDFNLLVRQKNWRAAWDCLSSTNSFPEFTSRLCPALCEAGCTQYLLQDSAVGIKTVERAIVDRAWQSGWIQPLVITAKTGKRVAVVGSGPSGLACAQQLCRAGHSVVVYEKSESLGGLLRLGIPDFKLTKNLIDRRIAQLQAEGVQFELQTAVGTMQFDRGVDNQAIKAIQPKTLLSQFDAVVLACGAETPRDLDVPGRDAAGVHFALELLREQNRVVAGQ